MGYARVKRFKPKTRRRQVEETRTTAKRPIRFKHEHRDWMIIREAHAVKCGKCPVRRTLPANWEVL